MTSISPKILMIVTSNDRLGETERKTGYWAEELAAPYRVFEAAGFTFDIASPRGGTPPIDPMSLMDMYQTPVVQQFLQDPVVQARLEQTLRLDQVDGTLYDAIFVVGGFGVMWDLYSNTTLHSLIAHGIDADLPVAAVCHAPSALAQVRFKNGDALVRGRRVTGFSNAEEDAVALGVVMPTFVEDALRNAGSEYVKGENLFGSFIVRDGLLLTGQNPSSSEALAHELVAALRPTPTR